LPLAVSIPEAAKLLGISKSLAYELAARGELDTIRLGRRIVVPRNVISKMLQLG
jgi:excisionase family DNA binding protein